MILFGSFLCVRDGHLYRLILLKEEKGGKGKGVSDLILLILFFCFCFLFFVFVFVFCFLFFVFDNCSGCEC